MRPEPSFRAYPKAPPSPQEAEAKKAVEANVQSGIAPFLLISALTLVPGVFAFDIADERIRGTMHLQTLMGVTKGEFWLSRAIFDFSQCFIISSASVVLFAAADTYLGNIETFIFMLIFFMACLPLTYLLQYSSDTPQKAVSSAGSFFLLSGILGYVPFFILSFPGLNASSSLINLIKWVGLLISPTGCLGIGLKALIECAYNNVSPFGPEKGSAQKEFFVMLGHLVFWPFALMAYERVKMLGIGSSQLEAANNIFCRCSCFSKRRPHRRW